ncbi:MAG TPA: hydroxylamine oxidation protein HaoB [Rubrivivax sp.]|nr:hydroxylamine oxidation protein HaoB [Burkholderiales bacterium]HNT39401.1 hydroxylamine oxidation protein HaoB [Rubrivivax sp.]
MTSRADSLNAFGGMRQADAAAPARRRPLSVAAIVAGVVLIAIAAALLWRQQLAPPPYRYVLGELVPAAELGALAELGAQPPAVRRANLVADDQPTPLAELKILEGTHSDGSPLAPLLLDWRARVDDPFLTIAAPPEDVAALAAVLARHARGAKVLAWWDHSRLFERLVGADVAFTQHLGIPLFIPAQWRGAKAGVAAAERAFWQAGKAPEAAALAEEKDRFERFAAALLAPEDAGIAALQALAGGGKAVLVLHLRDLILLGQMAPDKIGVAFQDLGTTADVHGMVRRVHGWLDEHKYPAYGVLQARERPLRAIALTDEASGRTLAARLLPLMGNEQHDVRGATLVYRVGGYSVFEIASAAPAPAKGS